jgi:NhaP-type Na+/H+ and K+/H+ antiporter
MNSSESRLANRVLLATAVLFAAALFWLFASSWIAGLITGKVWLSLVAAGVFAADRGYVWLCKRNGRE